MLGKGKHLSITLQVICNIFESHRKQNLFEGLPPSDDELSDGSLPALGKCKRLHVIYSPSDVDSPTEVGLDETNTNKEDYGNTFQP